MITVEIFQAEPFIGDDRGCWPRKEIVSWCEENCTGKWESKLLLEIGRAHV